MDVALTSVCCVQLPSSGITAVRKVRGAKAQSTESKRRDKLFDTLTNFYRNAKDQRRQESTAAKHTGKSQFEYLLDIHIFIPLCPVFFFLYSSSILYVLHCAYLEVKLICTLDGAVDNCTP